MIDLKIQKCEKNMHIDMEERRIEVANLPDKSIIYEEQYGLLKKYQCSKYCKTITIATICLTLGAIFVTVGALGYV
jgi:hypothetical protein